MQPFPQRRAFAESGAAAAVFLHGPTCEKGVQKRPQAFLNPKIKNNISLAYAQSERSAFQIVFFTGNQANTATTTCMATPTKAPAAHVRPVMKRFCFHEGLARHSTAKPTPAPVHSPATRLEKRSAPSTYSWVSSTLAAQLGMLKAAGLSACMANGTPDAKAAADRIIGDVREDGVAALIEELWFDGPRAEPSGKDFGSAWGNIESAGGSL